MMARLVLESPPLWCAAAEVEAAAAVADVAEGLVLVGLDDIEVSDDEEDELVVVLDRLDEVVLLDVEDAVLEASEASIDVTSV
jgi:hypothetical protein